MQSLNKLGRDLGLNELLKFRCHHRVQLQCIGNVQQQKKKNKFVFCSARGISMYNAGMHPELKITICHSQWRSQQMNGLKKKMYPKISAFLMFATNDRRYQCPTFGKRTQASD